MFVREARDSDLPAVLRIHCLAFGRDEEAGLVRDILADPSARPILSLLACDGERPLGHILFSRARLTQPDSTARIALLAPLAVVPEAQGEGVGGDLVEAGLQRLAQAGVELVFVLGHPGYYPRFGFEPAGRRGFEAPFPIPEADAAAWLVRGLREGVIDALSGKVVCADTLDKPAYWRE